MCALAYELLRCGSLRLVGAAYVFRELLHLLMSSVCNVGCQVVEGFLSLRELVQLFAMLLLQEGGAAGQLQLHSAYLAELLVVSLLEEAGFCLKL